MKTRHAAILSCLAVLCATTTVTGVAWSQQHNGAVHPAMPDSRAPAIHYPMSSENFHKLMTFYVDLAHKNQDKFSEDTRTQIQLATLRLRECTSAVTADGVVTAREARQCFQILQSVHVTPRPR